MRPAEKRAFARELQTRFGVSERRVGEVLGIGRSSLRYRVRADDQTALRMRLRDLAAARVDYGYRRLHVLLQREGWSINHKRVYRLYRHAGLQSRLKRSRPARIRRRDDPKPA